MLKFTAEKVFRSITGGAIQLILPDAGGSVKVLATEKRYDSGMCNLAYNMAKRIYDTEFIELSNKLALEGTPESLVIWDSIGNIYNSIILPIAYSLLCIYFMIELLEKTTHENFSIEQFFRMVIKLFLGKMLMDNAIGILRGMMNFGNSLMNNFTTNLNDGSISTTCNFTDLEAMLDSNKLLGTISLILALFIPFLIMTIIQIVIILVCWSRIIEIITRTLLAPIAMADMFEGGTRSTGFRYLKKYLALCLQGLVIMALLYASRTLMINIVGVEINFDAFDFKTIFKYVLCQGTTATLIVKSLGIANDICGV